MNAEMVFFSDVRESLTRHFPFYCSRVLSRVNLFALKTMERGDTERERQTERQTKESHIFKCDVAHYVNVERVCSTMATSKVIARNSFVARHIRNEALFV